jgi:hypothetical protein
MVEIKGVVQTVKGSAFSPGLQPSNVCRAYPRETQEMVMDAHSQAFAFYGDMPRQVNDNLKAVVDIVFVGNECKFNQRSSPQADSNRCGHSR